MKSPTERFVEMILDGKTIRETYARRPLVLPDYLFSDIGSRDSEGRIKIPHIQIQNSELIGLTLRNLSVSGGMHLTNSRLQSLTLQNVYAPHSSFRGTTVEELIISNSDLDRSDFSKTTLENGIIEDTDLRFAYFVGLQKAGIGLRRTSIGGAYFALSSEVYRTMPKGIRDLIQLSANHGVLTDKTLILDSGKKIDLERAA